MSQESAEEAPPSSEEADPISLRDVELEPVSLHDIERILAPGRSPPKLGSAQSAAANESEAPSEAEGRPESQPPKSEARAKSEPPKPATRASSKPPPKAEARASSRPPPKAAVTPDEEAQDEATKPYERREGLATTVSPEDGDVELGPDSAISDLRALVAASKAPPARESLVDEVLHMGSIMGDAPPPPLVPLDLANFVKDAPKETIKVEAGSKPRPKPPLKQKRTDAPAGETEPSAPAPAAKAEPARKSAVPAKSVTPASARPSKPASTSPATKQPEKSASAGSRTALFVAAGVAFLGVGYWLGVRNEQPQAAAPTVTVVVTERVPAETPAPVPSEVRPAEAAPVETAAGTTAEPPAEAPAPTAAPTLTGRLPEAGGPVPVATATSTAAVEPTPTAVATAEPEPAGAAFDKAAANAALASAVASASACKQEGDPSGQAKVQVTFAPSGRVTVANILGPPFAGTKTGGCIAKTFRTAKVPPFSGDPVTVSKTVGIP